MKKQHLLLSLMALLFSLLSIQEAVAKTEPRQDALYIFRNDGGFDFFFYGDIDRICYSKIDTLGVEQPDYVVQEVWALDTIYRIPLTAIDSVAFVTPENKLWPDVFCPDDRIANYIIDGDSIWWIRLAHDTPADLLPTVGGKMLIEEGVSPFIPDGFGGRVAVVEHEEDGWLVATEPTAITDIYQRLVAKAAGATPEARARHKARRAIIDGDLYDVPEMEFDILSFEKEFTLANSVISSPDDMPVSISFDLTGTWHPKCVTDLTLRSCLYIDVLQACFQFCEKTTWGFLLENALSLEGSMSGRLDWPLAKKTKKIDGLAIEFVAGPYIEGSIGGYKMSSTHKKEQEITSFASMNSTDYEVDHAGMIIFKPVVKVSQVVLQDTVESENYLLFSEEGFIQPPNTMSIGAGFNIKASTKLGMPLEKAKKTLPSFLVKYMQKYALNEKKDTIGFNCEAGIDLGGKLDMKAPWDLFLLDNTPLLESEPVFKRLDNESEFKATLFGKYTASLKLGPWTFGEPHEKAMSSRPRGLVPSILGVRVFTDTEQDPIKPYVKRFFSPITRDLILPVDIGFVVFDKNNEIVAKQCDLSWFSEDVFNQDIPFFKDGSYQFTMNIDPGMGEPVKYTAYPMVRLTTGHELLVFEGDYEFEVEAAAFDIAQRIITVGQQSGMLNGEYVGSMEVEVIPNMENVEVKTEDTWLRNLIWSGHRNELSFFWDDLPDGMRSRRGVIRLTGFSQKGEKLVEDSIVVIQSIAYVDVEPKQLTFPKEGGTQTVTITETSLTNITPSIVSDNIHVSMSDNVITVTADANTDESSRYVWIYIHGTAPDGRETSIPSIEVTQEGAGTDPSDGEVYNFSWGHLGGDYQIDIPDNNLSDLRLETSSSMLEAWFAGDDCFMVWCNKNYSQNKRSGTVKLLGTDSSGATVTLITVNVEQKQYSDTYVVKCHELGLYSHVLCEKNAQNPYQTTVNLGHEFGKYDTIQLTLEGNVMHFTCSDKWNKVQCSFDVLNWDEIDDNTLDGECLIIDHLMYYNSGSYFEAKGSLEIDEGWYNIYGWDWWNHEDDNGNIRPVKAMQYIATEGTGLTISNFYIPDNSYISNPDNSVEIEIRLTREYIYDE